MCDRLGDGVGRCPGGLEIKTSRDTVDIEHLTRKIEVGNVLALQRGGMDGREGDAATGNKLIFERRTTCYLIMITTTEQIGQAVQLLLVETAPTSVTPLA